MQAKNNDRLFCSFVPSATRLTVMWSSRVNIYLKLIKPRAWILTVFTRWRDWLKWFIKHRCRCEPCCRVSKTSEHPEVVVLKSSSSAMRHCHGLTNEFHNFFSIFSCTPPTMKETLMLKRWKIIKHWIRLKTLRSLRSIRRCFWCQEKVGFILFSIPHNWIAHLMTFFFQIESLRIIHPNYNILNRISPNQKTQSH